MKKDSRIFVAGHKGLVGSALVSRLRSEGHENLILKSRNELDLTKQDDVASFFRLEKPDYVFLAAAKVGGIWANNTYPAEFIHINLDIQSNVIHQSYVNGVKKLLFLGSSCIYPKECPQPMKEEYLLSGYLEPTNEPYAVAKIAGIKMCQAYNRQYGTKYISVMPTNLYGPNDSFDLENSHVLPALIRKFHLAKLATQGAWAAIRKDEAAFGPIPGDIKASLVAISRSHGMEKSLLRDFTKPSPVIPASIVLWGTGKPRREFLHVDDLADACVFLMKTYDGNDCINIGTKEDLTIHELAQTVAGIIGYEDQWEFDPSKPDGTLQKLLDVTKLENRGWNSQISLTQGVAATYNWYLANT